MKDAKDNKTIDGIARGRGRPKMYDSAGERQKAYRDRQKNESLNCEEFTSLTRELLTNHMKKYKKEKSESMKDFHMNMAMGTLDLWSRSTIGKNTGSAELEFYELTKV